MSVRHKSSNPSDRTKSHTKPTTKQLKAHLARLNNQRDKLTELYLATLDDIADEMQYIFNELQKRGIE